MGYTQYVCVPGAGCTGTGTGDVYGHTALHTSRQFAVACVCVYQALDYSHAAGYSAILSVSHVHVVLCQIIAGQDLQATIFLHSFESAHTLLAGPLTWYMRYASADAVQQVGRGSTCIAMCYNSHEVC